MQNSPVDIPDLSAEEIRELCRTDPEAFMRLYRQVFDVQASLAKYNINFFIQYVIKWEGRDEYVRQTPTHVDLQHTIDNNPQTLIWGAVGIGKAQPMYAKVLTPTGWKTIEQIQIGDEVVDPDGGTGVVTDKTSPEVRQVYEMATTDGRVVYGADDHLWPVHITSATRVDGRMVLATTEKIAQKFIARVVDGGTQPALWTGVVEGGSKPPYDPYLLGHMWSEAFDRGTHQFTAVRGVYNRIAEAVGALCIRVVGPERYALRGAASGLAESVYKEWWLARDPSERIAPPVHTWDVSSRSQFLAGFVDGSSMVRAQRGTLTVAVPSDAMAKYLATVAWTCGWHAHHQPRRLSVRPAPGVTLLTYQAKAARAYVGINAVRRLGASKVSCINVTTKRNLYFTDDYVVTHNCVTRGTVFIDDNMCPVRADELAVEHAAGHSLKVLDYDMELLKPRFVPVKSVSLNGYVPCQAIATDNGMFTVVSHNHPIYVHGNGTPTFVDAEAVTRDVHYAGTYQPKRQGSTDLVGDVVALGAIIGTATGHHRSKGSMVVTSKALATKDVVRSVRNAPDQHTRVSKLKVLKDAGVHVDYSGKSITFNGAAQLLRRWGFDIRHLKTNHLDTGTRVFTRIEGYRGRRMMFTPNLATYHESYAAGLFLAMAAWGENTAGVFSLNTTPTAARTLRWALWLAGVPSRLVFLKKHGILLYLETEAGAEFLTRVSALISGWEGADLRGIADAIRRSKPSSLKDNIKKVGMGTRYRSNTWRTRGDQDSRGFKFSQVVSSRRCLYPRQTYAVEVDSDQHTFITDGVFTHNTQQVSVARTLFWLGQNVNYRILIFMSSQDMAKDTLRQIKDYILNSSRYRRVFPNVEPGAKWSEYEILIKRQFESVTPSVRVIGTSTMIDGSRYDKIIGDDALSQKNTLTKGERDKTHKWIETVPLSRMADGCQVVIIGNAYHKEDSMHRLEKLPGYKSKRYPARDPNTGITLMPDIWPQSRIELWTRTKSPAEVRRAIDVVPWTNDSSRFKLEWLEDSFKRGCGVHKEGGAFVHFRTHYDLPQEQDRVRKLRQAGKDAPMPLDVVAGIDVGFGQTEMSDETAVTCGVPYDNGDLLVLYYRKGRLSEMEKYEEVYNLHSKFGATIFVEANFTQEYFYNHLRAQFPEAMILPWRTRGDGTIGNKWHTFYGVAALEMLFARRKIILPSVPLGDDVPPEIDPQLGDLADGLMTYTPDKSIHTHDGVMSLWIMSQGAAIRGGGEYLAGLIGRFGVESDDIYAEYHDDVEVEESASGVDASGIWNDVSPMLRRLGIPRRAKKRPAEEIAYENFSGLESD